MENIIEISHVTKDYGRGRGVFDVNFFVREGETLGFLGPNGAGKTTTIRQLMGFIRPDSGKLSVMGRDCFKEADKIHALVGYLPGEIAFIDSMSGMDFIRFVADIKKMNGLGRAQELIEMFELHASAKLKKMSKGMKQKIGIVCAFMHPDTQVYILDEPSSGLDPVMQNRFIDLVLNEKKQGKTILMSSHMFEEIERTCDRAAIIREGKIVAVEEMEKLQAGRQKMMEVTFASPDMAKAFAGEIHGAQYTEGARKVRAKVGKELDTFVKKAGRYTVTDWNVQTQSLEEFFLHFYGGEEEKV